MNETQIENRVMQINEALVGVPMDEVVIIATAMISISIQGCEDRAERQVLLDSIMDTLRGLCGIHDA